MASVADSGGKARLLLVDDDPLILTTLGRSLEGAGWDVLTARDAEEAVALLQKYLVDVAVLDVQMEGRTGVELAGWMRENTKVPFIFLSAYGDETIVNAAVSEGALSYLVKPVEVGQLVPVLHAALERGNEIRQLREQSEQLRTALAGDRNVSVAIGILMDRKHLTERQAFDALRSRARRERRKLSDLAAEMVGAQETLNQITRDIP